MGISMGIIVVLMFLIVLPTGLCTYSPGAPEGGPVQEVDAEAFLGLEARAADFPLVRPEDPDGWVTNSARRTQVADEPATVVGWVTDDEGYLQLTQTGVDLEDAVRGVDPDPRGLERTESIAGQEVRIYSSEEGEVRDLWAADTGDTRLLVSGAAAEEEFRELMTAALDADEVVVE